MTSTVSDTNANAAPPLASAPLTPPQPGPKPSPKPAPLGDELPIFCEHCGYSLHGLPPIRCAHCQVLHFQCPECGHHQPINTLRPAAARFLARLRTGLLVLWVFFKLNFFLWLLVAWWAMGMEWYTAASNLFQPPFGTYRPPSVLLRTIEVGAAFTMFAFPFGVIARLLLLRWPRGWLLGLVLATLVFTAIDLGGSFYLWNVSQFNYGAPPNLNLGLLFSEALAFVMVFLGCVLAWPIWAALVHLFLPKRTAKALLNWQRTQSDTAATTLA